VILHRITGIVVLVYTLLFFAGTVSDCADSETSVGGVILARITTIMFLMLSVGFFVTGLIMCVSLKSHFPEFYANFGCILKFATISLCFPLLIRGIDQWMLKSSTTYFCFYYQHLASANVVYATMTTITPAIAQMSSLIFGILK
jgi:hypothetical protein